MTQLTYNALGSKWYIDIHDEVSSTTSLKRGTNKIITEFEKNYSRFQPTSVIGTLNRERVIESPSEELLSLLMTGANLYTETGGIFNFLVGNILSSRGYGTEMNTTKLAESSVVPNPLLDLVVTKQKVFLTGDGAIDFGGYGKGFLIDKIARYFREELRYSNFVINGGGDIYVECADPVELYLEHPKDPSLHIGKVTVKNQALCCSSPFKRRWKDVRTNKIVSHIISANEESSFASYVISNSATAADAYSTTLTALNGEYHKLNPSILSTISFLVTDTDKILTSPNFPLKKDE